MSSEPNQTGASRPGRISRFLIFCSGSDPELLGRGGTETATFIGLGGTVLATAALAFVSSTFALSIAFGVPWWSILPFPLMWALIIFNLDRWLVASFRKLSNQFFTLLALVPRLLLAVLFGFIISEPVVLEIFGSEIEEELRDIDEATRQDRLEAIAIGPESLQIADKRAEIAAVEQRLGQSDDEEIVQLQAEVDQQRTLVAGWENEVAAARSALLESQASLEEEVVDGCRDNTDCTPGRGPIAREKQREVELREQELEAAEARLNPKIADGDARIAQLEASTDERRNEISARLSEADDELRRQIRILNDEIDDLEDLMNRLRADVNDGEFSSGILARIDALDNLRERSGNVNRMYWLLTLLFIAIDTIPILGKWIMSLGPPRPYELLRDAQERGVEAQVAKALERHEYDEQVQSVTAVHLANTQAANDRHFINHWAAVHRSLGEAQLAGLESEIAPPGHPLVSVASLPEVGVTIDPPLEPLDRRGPDSDAKSSKKAVVVGGGVGLLVIAGLALAFLVDRGPEVVETNVGGLNPDEVPVDTDSSGLQNTDPPASLTTTSVAEPDSTAGDEQSTPGESAPASPTQKFDDSNLVALRALIGEPDPARATYDRESFNEGQDADGDCVRTRDEVLAEEGRNVEIVDCKVTRGEWDDPFSGHTTTDPAELQIDHVVSLSDAWDSGAWAFSADERTDFGNNTENLNAIHGPENQRKANLGPAGYTPVRFEHNCAYLSQYASVKVAWGLSISQADFDAVASGLAECGGDAEGTAAQGLIGPEAEPNDTAATASPTTTAAPATLPSTTLASAAESTVAESEKAGDDHSGPAGGADGCHPSYSPCLPITSDLNCGDLDGGQKPVRVKGSDPYRLDGDNDGVGCEAG